ncbi:hypothetical protein F5B21DRAFT_357963 [Xylaria acuta]|nr:hypothetical protein F5B21DRAFT_357963 [Xylaria acuta]
MNLTSCLHMILFSHQNTVALCNPTLLPQCPSSHFTIPSNLCLLFTIAASSRADLRCVVDVGTPHLYPWTSETRFVYCTLGRPAESPPLSSSGPLEARPPKEKQPKANIHRQLLQGGNRSGPSSSVCSDRWATGIGPGLWL